MTAEPDPCAEGCERPTTAQGPLPGGICVANPGAPSWALSETLGGPNGECVCECHWRPFG